MDTPKVKYETNVGSLRRGDLVRITIQAFVEGVQYAADSSAHELVLMEQPPSRSTEVRISFADDTDNPVEVLVLDRDFVPGDVADLYVRSKHAHVRVFLLDNGGDKAWVDATGTHYRDVDPDDLTVVSLVPFDPEDPS